MSGEVRQNGRGVEVLSEVRMVLPEYPLVRRFRPGALTPILSTVDCRGGVGKGLKYTGMDCNCKGTRTIYIDSIGSKKGL